MSQAQTETEKTEPKTEPAKGKPARAKRHTLSSLWGVVKEIALSDDPGTGVRALVDEVHQAAKEELQDEKEAQSILTEGEEKPRLDSNGKA